MGRVIFANKQGTWQKIVLTQLASPHVEVVEEEVARKDMEKEDELYLSSLKV